MRGVVESSPEVESIHSLVVASLDRVQRRFAGQIASDLPSVNELCVHVERYHGKMLRPILVLLSGLAAHPRAASAAPEMLLSDEHITMAAVCEMVHMATLVHDDVLDEAEIRRRGRTLNALRGNEAAVLLGDYLIASAFHLCSQLGSQEHALAIGHVSRVLCAGELLQIDHRDDWSLDEATYFQILERKTASLIAVACERGALISGASEADAAALGVYGRRLGVAFQIQDDLLDLTGQEGTVGKSVGKDIEKGKLTLPLILHLANADARERGECIRLIQMATGGAGGGLAREGSHTERANLADRLLGSGSLARAHNTALDLVADAKAALMRLSRTPARSVLERMADAAVNRSL